LKVKESKPFGEDLVTTSECIGHIHKRVDARLHKLCIQNKGKKLYDDKPLNGLTNKIIDTIQNYCSMAIRQNTHSLAKSVNVVYASLYHFANTDENPNHSMC